jgi:hypothetical protein
VYLSGVTLSNSARSIGVATRELGRERSE